MAVKPGWLYLCLFLIISGINALPTNISAQAEAPIIENIRFEIIDAPGDEGDSGYKDVYWKEIAENLIFLKKGERFSEKWFTESLNALRNSTLFKSIDVPDPNWSDPPITLTFRLTPFPRIEEILISGGFPILEREIRNVMTIVTGDPYAPEIVSGQAELIRQLFLDEGFIDPEVEIDAIQDQGTGNYTIEIDIDTGRFYRIETVTLNGNQNLSETWLKIRLATWQSSFLYGGPSRLVENTVRDDEETLLDYYREKRYAEADVSSNIERNQDTGTASVSFDIKEGPRYNVEISGYDYFWGWTLKKDLAVFDRGNRSGLGLRRTIRNIEKRYQESGFLDVEVDMEDETVRKDDRAIRNVRIIIEEGPRYVVNNVSIEGNDAFPEERIQGQMITGPPGFLAEGGYVPATLDEDIQAIRTFYLQNGYQNTRVEKKIETRASQEQENIIDVDVILIMKEGPQTLVSSVSVEGHEDLERQTLLRLLDLDPGTPYRPNLIGDARIDLAAKISERGYPHVTVEPQVDISDDRTRADIKYRINEGPYVEMGRTFYIGNFKTTRGTLSRRMKLEPGEPFSLEKMLESQSNIRGINALESAKFQTVGLEEKAPEVDLLVEVQEKRPYYAEFTVGYDTWRNMYIDTAVGNTNFLGLNKEIRAGVQWSQIGHLAQIGITEPDLLNTGIALNAILFTEEREEFNQDFGVRTHGAAVGVSRDFLRNFTGSLNVGYENRELYRLDDDPIPPEDVDLYDPRSVVITTPGILYNNTDSFVRPTRGTLTNFKVDISHGLNNSLDDYFKYRLDSRYYYTPLDPVTLAFRGFLGYIDPYGDMDVVPEDQLFFLGGTTDIRGFAENELRIDADGDPVGGRTAIIASMEIRYDIGWNLEFVTFYDGGTIRNPLRDAGSDDWRSAAGLGLRYITPIGPIGLMYGRKIDRKNGESPGAIHFAIGYTF